MSTQQGRTEHCMYPRDFLSCASATALFLGNLVSQTCSSQFVGSTASDGLDYGARSGGRILNAGAVDKTDIPSATDIIRTSRPQGAALDIGRWALVVTAAGKDNGPTLIGVT